jgi:hypothetical protein
MGHGIPLNVQQTSLLYNEYIVYNTDQIKMKYLLHLDFQYKYELTIFLKTINSLFSYRLYCDKIKPKLKNTVIKEYLFFSFHLFILYYFLYY